MIARYRASIWDTSGMSCRKCCGILVGLHRVGGGRRKGIAWKILVVVIWIKPEYCRAR
jgi:hypothetical protein